MANHVRRQIREAVATAVTGLATTGARVYQSRVYPLESGNLPGLLIRTYSESSKAETIHAPKLLQRLLLLEVIGIAKYVSDLDDVLDQICKEVETALAPPVGALGALAKDITLRSTDIAVDGDGDRPTGRARMIFEVEYYTADNAPDVAH